MPLRLDRLSTRLIALEVRRRRAGRVISLPVVVADYERERYLVALLGNDTNWVRNARAANGRAVLRHRRRETVRLEGLDPSERAPILRRYLVLAPGRRAHFPIDRDALLPDFQLIASDYPAFRIRTA